MLERLTLWMKTNWHWGRGAQRPNTLLTGRQVKPNGAGHTITLEGDKKEQEVRIWNERRGNKQETEQQ